MTLATIRVAALGLTLLLSGCAPPLSGTFEDVEDATRFYTFSKWSKTWTSYYDETGSYEVEGEALTLDVSGGITGQIVSANEIRLNDVPALRVDKPYNVYRRRPDTH